MRTEFVDPRFGLNSNEANWIYAESDVMAMIVALDLGKVAEVKRILIEQCVPLSWQSNK